MDYLALAKSVVQKASSAGLEVEVIISEEKETSISVQAGLVEKLSQSGSHGMGVRVIANGSFTLLDGFSLAGAFTFTAGTQTINGLPQAVISMAA